MGRDAINDILHDPRFEGAITNIRWLTEFLDNGFIQFISIIAFFIISAALLRNVVAGAYAAFPKFWDMIADAKESMKGKQISLGGQDVSFLAKIGAFFIPNLKALSDFADNTIEPKHYFIKAIPQMILVVMIGITIYNGYYRDAVAITARFGTDIFDKVILNTDPTAIIEKLFSSMGRPSFVSETDETALGRYADKISKEAYGQIISFYSDVDDDGSKSLIAKGIESTVYNFLQSKDPSYLDEEKYSMKYQVDRLLGQPDLSRIEANNGIDPTQTSFATSLSIPGLGFDSLQHVGEEWYIRIVIRFEKKVEKIKDTGIYQDLVLTLSDQQCVKSGNAIASIKINSSTDFYTSGGNTYTYEPTTGVLKFNKVLEADSGVIVLSPRLSYTTSDGKQHAVSEIHVVPGTTNFAQTLQSESRPDINTHVGGDFSTAGQ